MNKAIHLSAYFKAVGGDNEDLFIEGMASTNTMDRMGDIVSPEAWERGGVDNYLKNPVILFNHDYNSPIGKAVDLVPTPSGLRLRAKISKSAGNIVELIKDGVLSAFSIGFLVKDAEYDSAVDAFLIKAVDLLEISVVSVPANQDAVFSIAKQFESKREYQNFVKNFTDTVEIKETKKMDENQMKELLAEAAKNAAKEATKAFAMQQAEIKAAEEAARKAAQDAEAARVAQEKSVSVIVESRAKELMDDVTKRFEEKGESLEKLINELKSDLISKSEEIQAMRTSKMSFSDRASKSFEEQYENEIVSAQLLGIVTRKGWNTKYAKGLLEKAVNTNSGVTVPTASVEPFETIVSTAIERDIEMELVIAPMFTEIPMSAASLVVPTMPDAGYATFNNAAGSGASNPFTGNLEARGAGHAADNGIAMGHKILTVQKLISKSYIAKETEEDAIIPVLPLIRQAMVRAHARSVEHSFLLGQVATYDLISSGYKGMARLAVDDSKVIDLGSAGQATATASALLAARQAMGKFGYRPNDVVYIVSLSAYYDLLNDAEFQNLNEVGNLATKIRGELGQVFGSPVVVCDEFPNGKTQGAPWMVAVNRTHFVVPRLRGLTVELDYDVENQRQVLVATQRLGFDRIFATAGQVVSRTW